MMKSPPSRHDTRSPSSTLSDSNSPPLTISTRKPRTPRKRPNQMYNEAAVLLSTANPNIFSSNHKTPFNDPHFLPIRKSPLIDYNEPSDLFLPFKSIQQSISLLHSSNQTKSDHYLGGEIEDLEVNQIEIFNDFDAESILDEEIEEGIESIMGKIESSEENRESGELGEMMMMNSRYGSSMSMGLGLAGNFELGFGLRSSLRDNDDENWWRFSTVEFEEIFPRIQTTTSTITAAVSDCSKKKNKKKKVAPAAAATVTVEPKRSESGKEDRKAEQRGGLLLKLDYDGVLEAWSGKDLPFSGEIMGLDLDAAAGVDKSLVSLSRRR